MPWDLRLSNGCEGPLHSGVFKKGTHLKRPFQGLESFGALIPRALPVGWYESRRWRSS